MESIKINNLFDLEHTLANEYLKKFEYPWQALKGIGDIILEIGKGLSEEEYDKLADDIWVAKDATVFPSAYIAGPAIIGHKTEVRHGAYIRGKALVGNNCVVGNST